MPLRMTTNDEEVWGATCARWWDAWFTGPRPGGANVPTFCQDNQLEFVVVISYSPSLNIADLEILKRPNTRNKKNRDFIQSFDQSRSLMIIAGSLILNKSLYLISFYINESLLDNFVPQRDGTLTSTLHKIFTPKLILTTFDQKLGI